MNLFIKMSSIGKRSVLIIVLASALLISCTKQSILVPEKNHEKVGLNLVSTMSLSNTYSLAKSGTYIYTANGGDGLSIIDVSNPTSPRRLDNIPSIAAYEIKISGNYAYVGAAQSIIAIDISNPESPNATSSFPTTNSVYNIAISGNYILAEGNCLYIFDISNPASLSLIRNYSQILGVSSIAVQGNYAYLGLHYSGLSILDVSNPGSAMEISSCNIGSDVIDVKLNGNYAYVLTGSTPQIYTINVTIPTAPAICGNHSLSGYPRRMVANNNYIIAACGEYSLYEDILIVDVRNSSDLYIAGHLNSPGIAYNIVVDGDYIYIADFNCLTVLKASYPND